MVTDRAAEPYLKLRAGATVLLATLAGVLICLPLSTMTNGALRIVAILIGAALGCRVGYLKRESTLFFYVSLVAVVLLSQLYLSP